MDVAVAIPKLSLFSKKRAIKQKSSVIFGFN